jgi:hypothetical protein
MATKLEFEDTDEFYGRLKDLIEADEEIVIETHFEHEDDVPDKLKKSFQLPNVSGEISNAAGQFIAGAQAISGLNAKPIWVMGGAAAGAATGGTIGGLTTGGPGVAPGALIGGASGALFGAISAATLQEHWEVEVTVDAEGKLRFRVTPKSP